MSEQPSAPRHYSVEREYGWDDAWEQAQEQIDRLAAELAEARHLAGEHRDIRVMNSDINPNDPMWLMPWEVQA